MGHKVNRESVLHTTVIPPDSHKSCGFFSFVILRSGRFLIAHPLIVMAFPKTLGRLPFAGDRYTGVSPASVTTDHACRFGRYGANGEEIDAAKISADYADGMLTRP